MKNNLIVLGSAKCVWHDLDHCPIRGDVMAINMVGLFYNKPLRYYVSMHPQYLPAFKEFRRLRAGYHNYPEYLQTHGFEQPRDLFGGDVMWNTESLGGSPNGTSSGCLGAMIGLKLGYEKIVLCGIPMDDTGHFYDYRPIPTDNLIKKRKRFQKISATWGGKVQSMSGWTKRLLGSPLEE